MKIIHISPNAPYNEGWSYQENILPKYQAKLGHEVILIVTNEEHRDGRIVRTECTDGVTADGFRVIRMQQRPSAVPVLNRSLKQIDVYEVLKQERPDFIFYHGMVSATIFQVCRYRRMINPECVIVQDNHMDYNIGFDLHSRTGVILKMMYSAIFRMTRKHISKVYGVTPWRVEYAQEAFGVPEGMTDVLIMGADDEKICFDRQNEIRQTIRRKNGITDDEFLIVTGGKIDERKKIHLLMEAVNRMENVRLLVFGNVLDDIREQFERRLSERVQWVGFIPADEAYDYFFAADLVFFPGQHSVLWEQACACKKPCVFARWKGMDHVDHGGNARFVDDVSVEGIRKCIESLNRTAEYEQMKACAESEKTDIYLYSSIAEKSLEMMNGRKLKK